MLLAALTALPMTSLYRRCEAQAASSPGGQAHPVMVQKTAAQQTKTERWDELALIPGTLHATPPLLGEIDSLPTFTRELVQVEWRAHDPIDLYVIRPVGVTRPPVILFLYGYPSDTDRFRNDAYCESVVKNGFAAIGFVSALTGQRYHDRPMKEWFISELPEALGSSVHDVQMILNYLADRHDLDLNRVGMYGQGSGGSVAILAASVDPRLKFVDALDPWGDWPDWIASSPLIPEDERSVLLKPDFLQKVAAFDPVHLLPHMNPGRFRLQQTFFSLSTPEKARSAILAAAPQDMPNVRYRNVGEYQQKAIAGQQLLEWLKNRLSHETKR